MRYRESMIEAVRQVGLYEALDYAIIDGDNKIIGLYKGSNGKKQAELNMKAAERQVGVKKPLKVRPVSKKKVGDTIIGIGELTDKQRGEIEEDRKNALAGFDNRIRDAASMDRKDFIKAKELYKRKDVKGLRKHIYSLDTSPLETVMNLISIQDRPFFDKMYPNTRGGEFLARIAYQHRHLDENLDENKDDEKKRMKGAKLKLKMGETIKEENIRVLVKDVKDRNFIKDLTNKAKQLKVDVSEKGGRYIFSGEKMKVNDVFNFAFDKSIKRGNYDPATMMHEGFASDAQRRAAFAQGYKAKGKKDKKEEVKEDGHTDVSSAIRQCKTVLEDAMQIMGKLKSMSGEDSLPTWWTNKLAVASNSMNKMRDYLLVPSVSESVELDEKAGDENDMKKLVGELQNASKMHLAQSKRVKAHVDMMKSGNLKGTLALAPIVGELENASKAHLRQSKTIAKHMEGMSESVIKEQPEHEITVGNYTTKHFYMCGSAQTTMKKHADKEGAEELTRMQDMFYKMEKDAMDAGGASEEQKKKSQILYDKIMAKAKEVGIADEVGKYMKMHLDSMLKNNPKLGFGRTDVKESYQEMISRIMSRRSMR